ncbi:hypothetical protein sos41_33530 [Alphaproteobacteria bacterium SO-S41]|nr:hypothetical protein sos41_33530 [Alphaproteobacteria bacterium SO-S41]
MSTSPQKRALKTYRDRLKQRGMTRFEVLGLERDRSLIRTLAKQLAEGGDAAAKLRKTVGNGLAGGDDGPRGGILAALRRSPLVGADLDLTRDDTPARSVDL